MSNYWYCVLLFVQTNTHTHAQEHFSFHVHILFFFFTSLSTSFGSNLCSMQNVFVRCCFFFLCFSGRYLCRSSCLYLEISTVAMSLGDDTFFYKNPQIQLIWSVQSFSLSSSSSLHIHSYSFFIFFSVSFTVLILLYCSFY